MPSTIAEVDRLFAAGAESVKLTRAEWEAIQEVSMGYSANHLEVSRARREVERITRVSKPVWRARKIVAAQMRNEMSYAYRSGQVPAGRIFDWEMRLRHSMDVSWSDLPENHPRRMVDWRHWPIVGGPNSLVRALPQQMRYVRVMCVGARDLPAATCGI